MVAADAVCYRHPDRPAAVGCQRCDRPICPSDMRQAAVGFHCPECVKATGQKVFRPNDLLNKQPKVTIGLIAVLLVIFVAQKATTDQLTNDGLLYGPYVQHFNEYFRIVTAGFLHGGVLHVAANCYGLYLFGSTIERSLGAIRMLLIYAGGLFGGSAAVMALAYCDPTIGASGAVLGLAGGLAGILWAQGRSIMDTNLGMIFLLNLGLPLFVPSISLWGHFGGIVGGAIIGAVLVLLPSRFGISQQKAQIGAAAACLSLGLVAIVIAEMSSQVCRF